MRMTAQLPKQDMLGLQLDSTPLCELYELILSKAKARQSGYCCVANVHQCVLVHDNPSFAAKVNGATFVIPDSVILQRARSARHSVPFVQVRRGADIMIDLCQSAAAAGVAIGLVGGKNAELLRELTNRLQARFPAIEIAYAMSPPFRVLSKQENERIINDIRQSGAGLIFVGLGCPKQEIWMADHSDRIDAMMIGVGAAFDFNSGAVPLSPQWLHKVGLEWLYRLLREPHRLFNRYFTTSPRFLWLVIMDVIRNKGGFV